MNEIVVGVDGSTESRVALAWAASEARRHAVPLEVVYVFDDTPAYEVYRYPEGLPAPGDRKRHHEEERSHAARLVQEMVADLDAPELTIGQAVIQDRRPARALLRRAEDAQMLVVGSRGRGGFQGLLLGSVSQQCVQHATCPVVIVPTRQMER